MTASGRPLPFAAQQLRAACAPTDVAITAGFADQSHLSQAFRRYADLTPSLYERGDVAFLQDSKVCLPDDGALRNFGDASP